MKIAVEGSRVSITDWKVAQTVPRHELPVLTPEQREVAKKLGVPEEDYARSALANNKAMEKLLAETERVARLLRDKLKAIDTRTTLESVTLNTWEDRFEIEINVGGARFPLRIAEEIIDDLFELGSAEAQERLGRILEVAFQTRTA